nr:BON1-associated protein 2 [Ipomoea batatas]
MSSQPLEIITSRKSSTLSPASRIFSLDPSVSYSSVSPLKAFAGTSTFIATQIQRPFRRFHDVLNIGATVYKATKFDLAMMNEVSATSFHDLMHVEERKPHPPSSTPERHRIEGKP